jgi:hypothetical protein
MCFVDDLTQITKGHYKYRFAAHATENEIEQMHTFDIEWRMSTRKGKFAVIPIQRGKNNNKKRKPNNLRENNRVPIQGTLEKTLGRQVNRHGIAPQMRERKNTHFALTNVNKIYRLKHLSEHTIRLLYITRVR